jgi:hypothetical protein
MNWFRVTRFATVSVACAGLVAAAFLVRPAILPVSKTCACTHGPTEPAWPVSVTAARAAASPFATADPADLSPAWWESAGGRLYTFSDDHLWIAVDGDGAGVVAALYESQMPTSAGGSISAANATTAAEAFLTGHSIDFGGSSASTSKETPGPVAYFDVSWPAPHGTISAAVDASDGQAFWYFDGRRSHLSLATPAIGYQPALALATASEPSDASIESGWLAFDPTSVGLRWDFGATIVRDSGNYKTTDWVQVDASTGVVTRQP